MVIRLGVTGLKKTWRRGSGDLVYVDGAPLDDGINGSYVDVLLKRVVSVALVT